MLTQEPRIRWGVQNIIRNLPKLFEVDFSNTGFEITERDRRQVDIS